MSDQLDKLTRAFRQLDAVEPSGDSRNQVIDAAVLLFEEESEAAAQGIGDENRLNNQTSKKAGWFEWRRIMNIARPKLPYIMAGGASLAALAVAVNVNLLELAPGLQFEPAEKVVNETGNRGEDRSRDQEKEEEVDSLAGPLALQDADQSAPIAESFNQGLVIGKVARKLAVAPQSSAEFASVPSSNDVVQPTYKDQGRDKFSEIVTNPVKVVAEDPVSTFSVDVDTASYAFVRGALNGGVLPQKDAVRVEEMINYFDYTYEPPTNAEAPFKAHVSVMPTPWNEETKLLRIGIKGYELPKSEAPKANLVFLLDTSGSMNSPDKLPLLINSFKLLLSSLKPDDTVSIVTYAGSAGTVLEPTKVADKAKILSSLERLYAGGSTAGAEGIRQAYQLAEANKVEGGVNRVILATDGDFNVGITDPQELKSFVERKRKSGVTLSVLGFGQGNYNDELMQTLAQNGNGNAAYIDTLNEARKVLVEEAGSTLFTIAKDVKLQIEFNPSTVSEYRLIGYETRMLNREDFNNDKVDAGDIGAGHTVTALYEMTPSGTKGMVDGLRYQNSAAKSTTASDSNGNEYAFMKIRYKLPDSDTSTLITAPITTADEVDSVKSAPREARFATAVAAFGQLLRGGQYTGDFDYDKVIELANSAKGNDPFGYRAEFVNLVRLAKSAAALEPLK